MSSEVVYNQQFMLLFEDRLTLDSFLELNAASSTVSWTVQGNRGRLQLADALPSRDVVAARHRREAHHIQFHSLCSRIHLEKSLFFRGPGEKLELNLAFTAR
jgi:hypothetical protein